MMMYDLLILGAGPAGLTAAIYAARMRLNYLVLEQDGWGGGQISGAYQVNNYPGVQDITGKALGEAFRAHAVSEGADIRRGKLVSVTRTEGGFAVVTDEERYESKTVIAATGALPKELGVPGEAEYTGNGVSYSAARDGANYAGKDVLVVGGGNNAVGAALYLAGICAHVTVAIRRDRFRAAEVRVQTLRALDNVTILTDTNVTEIRGGERMTGVVLKQGDQVREMAVDGLFIAVGTQPSSDYLAGLSVLTPEGDVLADESGTTQVPGLFVAGDLRKKPFRQVVTAVADGANAVNSAMAYLRGRPDGAHRGNRGPHGAAPEQKLR